MTTVADLQSEVDALTARVQTLEADAKAAPEPSNPPSSSPDAQEFMDKFYMFGPSRAPVPADKQQAQAPGAAKAPAPALAAHQ